MHLKCNDKQLTQSNRKNARAFGWVDVIAVIVSILAYIIVARVFNLSYPVKSCVKLIGFIIAPLCMSKYFYRDLFWLKFRISSDVLRRKYWVLIIASFVLLCIVFLFRDLLSGVFGVARIIDDIRYRNHYPAYMFLFGGLYISLINTLAEEVFFRGYILQRLKCRIGYFKASFISSAIFSVYHLAIFRNWFNPGMLVLALAGLLIAGLVLNQFTEEFDSLLPSWTIHGLMNITIFVVAIPFFLA